MKYNIRTHEDITKTTHYETCVPYRPPYFEKVICWKGAVVISPIDTADLCASIEIYREWHLSVQNWTSLQSYFDLHFMYRNMSNVRHRKQLEDSVLPTQSPEPTDDIQPDAG